MPSVLAYARLEGSSKVCQELRNLAEGVLRERLQKAVMDGAEIVAQEVRHRAPVGTRPPRKGVNTGRLKKSIKTKGIRVDPYKRKVGAYVYADYPENAKVRPWDPIRRKKKKTKAGYKEYYAFAPEYGTGVMAARPFLAPALEAKASEVQEFIVKALEELCEETEQKI